MRSSVLNLYLRYMANHPPVFTRLSRGPSVTTSFGMSRSDVEYNIKLLQELLPLMGEFPESIGFVVDVRHWSSLGSCGRSVGQPVVPPFMVEDIRRFGGCGMDKSEKIPVGHAAHDKTGQFVVGIPVVIGPAGMTREIWFTIEELSKVKYSDRADAFYKAEILGNLSPPSFIPQIPDVRLFGVWSHEPGKLICDKCELIG